MQIRKTKQKKEEEEERLTVIVNAGPGPYFVLVRGQSQYWVLPFNYRGCHANLDFTFVVCVKRILGSQIYIFFAVITLLQFYRHVNWVDLGGSRLAYLDLVHKIYLSIYYSFN